MSSCIFCKIIAGEIPAAKIYEDDLVLAFLDHLIRKELAQYVRRLVAAVYRAVLQLW